MTDFDDRLRKRYRELEAAEPPAALDQAILAAAKRAVAPRRVSWAMPVSAAAVLVLAVGVTLRMQQEKPGIESSMPSEPPPQVASAPTPPVDDVKPAAPPAPAAKADAPQPRAKQRAATAPPPAAPAVKLERQLEEVPAQAKKEMAERNQAAPQEARPAPEPKPFSDASVAADKPQRAEKPAAAFAQPAAPPASIAAPAAAPPAVSADSRRDAAAASESDGQRNKRATLAAGSSAPLAKDSLDPREKELQRIAQLRRDGKHADADEALRIFRRDNPDYRIPDALWEQVKPR